MLEGEERPSGDLALLPARGEEGHQEYDATRVVAERHTVVPLILNTACVTPAGTDRSNWSPIEVDGWSGGDAGGCQSECNPCTHED
jgi:hypothetical protein